MTQVALQNKVSDLAPNLGMQTENRRAVAESISDALADAFRLYFNAQTLHWNVEGPLFFSLHKLTEEQYETLAESVDKLAERIRALGMPAPQTLEDFIDRSAIDDLPTDGTLAERTERLIRDYEAAGRRLSEFIRFAEGNGDIKSADLLTTQLGDYDEFAWMLRATIAS